MAFEYLFSVLAWSLVGFILGYITCAVTAVQQQANSAAVQEDVMPFRHLTSTPNRLVGWLVVLMSILTVAGLAYSNHQQRTIVDCQARVNGQLVAAVNARAVIADQDRDAINHLVLAIAKGSGANVAAYAAIRKASEDVIAAGVTQESLNALTATIARSYTTAGPQDRTQTDALGEFVATIQDSKRARDSVELPGPHDYECGR